MSQSACHAATGARPHSTCELADVFRRYGSAYRCAHRLPLSHLKVMHAIESCRTPVLGGHRESCRQCGFVRYAYNSCRNRHCPKCQSLAKAQWLEARQAELLPVPYFHNVFTLPHELNPLILCHETNQRTLLKLLFHSAAETLLDFGRNNLGGTLGITLILHTWDQLLRAHFHVHAVVTGGVLASDRSRWIPSRHNFLFPVQALSQVFRAKFLQALKKLYDTGQLLFPKPVAHLARPIPFRVLLQPLWKKPWVVYSKAPFAGPRKLLDYLGRYTHRVAISNCRLLSIEDGHVRFRYRDRANGDRPAIATLPAEKFMRRFLQHVVPAGFMRIRHYGILSNCTKQHLLAHCRNLLQGPPAPAKSKRTTAQWILLLSGIDITQCPQCGHRPLERTELPPLRLLSSRAPFPSFARGPPQPPAVNS